jgi:DNA invertase Pin-like site-specific DNA recombinase
VNRCYLRCSTDEQTTESQRHAIELRLAGAEAVWYDDAGYSGVERNRPEFKRLMTDLRYGDTVICFAMDRITREGIAATLNLLAAIRAKGAKVESVSEPWIGDDNPFAEVVTVIMAWGAQQERRRIKERQRVGIAAARKKNGGKCPWGGRNIGTRITLTEEKELLARKLKEDGHSVVSIARNLGISRKTVYVALARKAGEVNSVAV